MNYTLTRQPVRHSQTRQLTVAMLRALLATEGKEQVLQACAEALDQVPEQPTTRSSGHDFIEADKPHGARNRVRQTNWAQVVSPNGEIANVSAQVAVTPLLLNVKAAAEVLGISHNRLYEYVNGRSRSGHAVRRIPSVLLDGRRLFAYAALVEFVREILREQGQAEYAEMV